jgi:2-polyprenyl-3-methyl-5-hydroxy-6-metoxy-1,4-benzoquinol methylase
LEEAIVAEQFFDRFERFLDTSETGRGDGKTGRLNERQIERLNGRYEVLVHANRKLLAGARVLDLASHDGRWSIAALENGAASVVGIEHKPGLVHKSAENFEFYDVPKSKYEFICGDIFEHIDKIGNFDVVFCFGIFYHVAHHMLLLSQIAQLDPRAFIMDTNVSLLDGDVIELMFEAVGGNVLVGQPTKTALRAMFASFGWSSDFFDWRGSGLCGPHSMSDYWSRKRLTVTVKVK